LTAYDEDRKAAPIFPSEWTMREGIGDPNAKGYARHQKGGKSENLEYWRD